MKIQKFRNDVLDVTLKSIDTPPHEWKTFNDSLHTRIIKDTYQSKVVNLEDNELAILECDLNDSYLLITTKRVISKFDNSIDQLTIEEMDKFLNDYEAQNYRNSEDEYPKTNKIAIKKKDGSILTFLIDSYHPAFFAKILILNLFCYSVYGRWYLNPSR